MTPTDAARRLMISARTIATTIDPALDKAAEAVAADTRRRLATGSGLDGADDLAAGLAAAVSHGRDREGRATVTVASPRAAEREFGTRRAPARPFLRPAVAAQADESRALLADALRQALMRDAP